MFNHIPVLCHPTFFCPISFVFHAFLFDFSSHFYPLPGISFCVISFTQLLELNMWFVVYTWYSLAGCLPSLLKTNACVFKVGMQPTCTYAHQTGCFGLWLARSFLCCIHHFKKQNNKMKKDTKYRSNAYLHYFKRKYNLLHNCINIFTSHLYLDPIVPAFLVVLPLCKW